MSAAPMIPGSPDARHASAWLAHAFAQRMVALARRLDAPDAVCRRVWRAAQAVSLALADGHVCIALSDLLDEPGTHELFPADAPLLASWREALYASGVCGRAGHDGEHHGEVQTPLLLDAQDRLYLARYYEYEKRLARSLRALAAQASDAGASALSADDVARLRQHFDAGTIETGGRHDPNWQMAAAALALHRRVVILSGGPGTGKTTTVVGLLACLLAREPALRVALAAPTGKAAQRMQEALAGRAAHLPPAVHAALPAALTLHRLLGVVPDSAGMAPRFRHHRDNPLLYDLIVIDEASMIDLSLATHLLEAVPPNARLILLGDKDQLAAVEAGAVFAELSARPVLLPDCRAMLASALGVAENRLRQGGHGEQDDGDAGAALADSVIWLEHNYRFGGTSAIGLLADAIKHGSVAEARRCLSAASAEAQRLPEGSAVLRESAAPQLAPEHLAELIAGYGPYRDAVASYANHPGDPFTVFDTFGRFRVLCATRGGQRGVDALNRQLGAAFADSAGGQAPAPGGVRADPWEPWYCGRPVIVTQNDYALGLFNGDIGIALPAASSDAPAGTLRVFFPAAGGAWRQFAPGSLPAHETAFAMTVHKSQGSEFDRVAIVLPEQASRILTRELVYTAITRARLHATLYAPWQAVATAIASPTRRASGLADRLRESA